MQPVCARDGHQARFPTLTQGPRRKNILQGVCAACKGEVTRAHISKIGTNGLSSRDMACPVCFAGVIVGLRQSCAPLVFACKAWILLSRTASCEVGACLASNVCLVDIEFSRVLTAEVYMQHGYARHNDAPTQGGPAVVL